MDRKSCPTCGAEISPDHPHGLCPACLLKEGLQSGGPTGGTRWQCAACQSALEEDARFCSYCGTAVPVAPAAEGDPLRKALETKLLGQYRLVRLLGRGGMGFVYLARDLTLDREVAIKVVKTDADPREVFDRFRREAKTAAKLSHPNIVPLHAFGEVEGMPYFVMGYVRGESLAARLRRDGKLPQDEARRAVAEIADALDHAHRQGIVHRDIKPDNVLLEDESGRALLTDFGVAKALGKGETLTRAGSVVGTPHYMSPEQAAGRADIDARSDIYSLGVMAYEMLAGRLPFEGGTAADVLKKHLTQEPPPLRSLAPTLSDSTLQAVERCLAKDPSRRFSDARSLKLALGVSDEPQLPDTLRAVEGQGMLAAYLVVVWLALLGEIAWPALQYSTAGIFAFIYGFMSFRLVREGLSFGQSQRAIWTEPSWWPLWYPRGLRRRGNVWDRLPAVVRQVRAWPVTIALGAWLFAAAAKINNQIWGWRRLSGDFHLGLFVVLVVGFGGMVVAWLVQLFRARRELRRLGLDPTDARRVMLLVPPSRVSFWTRPHIAAVLAPATRPEPSRRSDLPHDQLQSILRHADELSGPLRALGAQAAVAGRQLLASIDQADQEIAKLTRNLEPGEEERLADKIEALGAAPGDATAPMRQLLEKQLVLIRGLSGRIEETKEERNRRVEMLKTLALHLASLRARSAKTPTEVLSLSDRVQALCDDIARQALALAEVRGAGGGGIDGVASLGGASNDTKTRP